MNRLFILLFSCLIFLSGCGDDDLAPEIEAELIDGTPFKLSDLRGQYVIIEFWASWCGPSHKSMPMLVDLHQKYGDKVQVVTIAIERDDRHWKAASEKLGMTWKYQIVQKAKMLPLDPIAWSYGVTQIPTKFIVTPEGKLISGMRFQQIDEYFQTTLRQ